MDVAVRTVNLRKTYLSRGSRRVAVSGLSMTVPLGGVHGFLGPNGSGKTTTIRMLLGLVRADSGTAEVFGERCPDGCPTSSTAWAPSSSRRSSSPRSRPARTSSLLAGAIGSPRHAGRRGARGDAPRRPRPRPVCRLLARHEAAPRDRGDPAQGPRPAHLRRADQRTRPGGHPRGARHDEVPRRPGQDGARQLAHPRRGRAGRRHGVDHRARRAARRGPRRRHPRRRTPSPRCAWGSPRPTAPPQCSRRLASPLSARASTCSSAPTTRRPSPARWPGTASTSPSSCRCGRTSSRPSSRSPPTRASAPTPTGWRAVRAMSAPLVVRRPARAPSAAARPSPVSSVSSCAGSGGAASPGPC